MDLNLVAIFTRVVETGSLTAAASALGLPKSSVSRGLARLEADLGVRLLQRTTRKLNLTDAGHSYFERARGALAGLDEAAEELAALGQAPRGVIRVTCPYDLGVTVLDEICMRFVRAYPQVHLELHLTSRVVDLVEEGFDLAIRAGQLKDSTLIAKKVGASSLGLFAARDYLRRRPAPQSLAELALHECVLMRGQHGTATWTLTGPRGVETLVVRGPLSADDFLFVHKAVEAGVGIGLLPFFFASRCPTRDGTEGLVRVLPEYALHGGALYLVTPSTRYVPARVVLLRDFLAENLARLNMAEPAASG